MARINNFRLGFRDGAPIAVGYFFVSFAFGIVAAQKGTSISIATLMSATNLTSAGQLAALDIIRDNLSYLEMALAQFILNIRYLVMSMFLSQKFRKNTTLKNKLLVATFGVTDELFAITASQKGAVSVFYTLGAMFIAYPAWVLGTFFGVSLGKLMPVSLQSALGACIFGVFISILVPSAKKEPTIAIIIFSSMLLAFCFEYLPKFYSCIPKISSSFIIIIITILVSAVAAWLKPIKEI